MELDRFCELILMTCSEKNAATAASFVFNLYLIHLLVSGLWITSRHRLICHRKCRCLDIFGHGRFIGLRLWWMNLNCIVKHRRSRLWLWLLTDLRLRRYIVRSSWRHTVCRYNSLVREDNRKQAVLIVEVFHLLAQFLVYTYPCQTIDIWYLLG